MNIWLEWILYLRKLEKLNFELMVWYGRICRLLSPEARPMSEALMSLRSDLESVRKLLYELLADYSTPVDVYSAPPHPEHDRMGQAVADIDDRANQLRAECAQIVQRSPALR